MFKWLGLGLGLSIGAGLVFLFITDEVFRWGTLIILAFGAGALLVALVAGLTMWLQARTVAAIRYPNVNYNAKTTLPSQPYPWNGQQPQLSAPQGYWQPGVAGWQEPVTVEGESSEVVG